MLNKIDKYYKMTGYRLVLLLMGFALFSNLMHSQTSDKKIITFTYDLSGKDASADSLYVEENADASEDEGINDSLLIDGGRKLTGTATVINLTDSITAEKNTIPADSLAPVSLTDSISTAMAADTSGVSTSSMPADSIVQEIVPEPSNWERGGQTAFNFSQISLSNWSAGGQNSVSFNSYLNLFARYKSPDENMTWENTLDVGFGKIKQEDKATVKSDDKIDFSSKFGRRASETWFYSTLFNFRTQMAEGYKGDNYISNFLAPAIINVSIGMDHKFDENINFYLSPLAGKVTMVMSDFLSNQGAYGVEPGENIKYEFGGFVRAQFRATLMENITVTSKLEFFSNYGEKPQNLDVNSDTRINMKVNKFISANVVIQMMYDENTLTKAPDGTNLGPKLQLKQVFGLGFAYNF